MQEAKPVLHIQKLAGRISQLETHVTNLRQQQPLQEGQLDTLALAVQGLHVKVDHLAVRLDRVEQRLDRVEQRLDSVERRLDGLDFQMSQLRNWLDTQFAEIHSTLKAINEKLS